MAPKLAPVLVALSLGGAVGAVPAADTPATVYTLPAALVGLELPAELAALQSAGRLTEAIAWIDSRLPGGAPADDPLVVERQRLERLRRDYSVTAAALLETMRATIADLTADEIEAWRQSGELQWIMVDGEPRFFRREPRNLFRRSAGARARRDGAAAAAPAGDPSAATTAPFDLHREILAALDEAAATGTTTPSPLRLRATHTVTVAPGAVPPGEVVRCWIPFPQEYGRQRDVALVAAGPGTPVVAPNGVPQRTVYLEAPAPAAGEPLVFRAEYVYTTAAHVPALDPALARVGDPGAEWLADEPPHVALTPAVRALAAEIVGEEQNPLLKADLIFRWMNANIRYCAELEYSVITSITAKALETREGDCGIQALLFIALCRAAGVPARWQSGWAMRPGSENLHDWAEFHVEPWGWLTADPSFGLRRHDDARVRDFYIGRLDPYRMVANLDFGGNFVPAKVHWRSDNIDNQRGELEWRGGNLYYDQWSYRMEVEYSAP